MILQTQFQPDHPDERETIKDEAAMLGKPELQVNETMGIAIEGGKIQPPRAALGSGAG
jgi:hypothetical protein